MTRVLAAALLLCLVGVSPAFAQERRFDFSARAAGVVTDVSTLVEHGRAPIPAPRPAVNADTRSPLPRQEPKKSFWRTPWPYVIAGAVVVGVVVASRGEGGIY